MSIDQSPPVQVARGPNWELPEVVNVDIRSATFQPRKSRHVASPLAERPNAVAIVVTLKAPMPIRALAPVLFVGDTPLTESEAVDAEGRQLRFWGFDRARLAADAPIALGWLGASRQAKAFEAASNRDLRTTPFRFTMPE
jgi:hypothetical protein